MSALSFTVPSIVSELDWTVHINKNVVNWDDAFRVWAKDEIFGAQPSMSQKQDVGKFIEFTDPTGDLDDFVVRLKKASDWRSWSQEGKPDIWAEGDWRPWGNIKASLNGIRNIRAGVFDFGGQLWLIVVVEGRNLGGKVRMPPPPVAGMEGEAFSPTHKKWWDQSVSFFYRLGDINAAWHALAGSTGGGTDAGLLGDPNPIFAAINQGTRRTCGTNSAGKPFAGFIPFLRATESPSFGPVMYMRLDGAGSRLKSVKVLKLLLGANARNRNLSIDFDWMYPSRDLDSTDPASYRWAVTGKVDQGVFADQFVDWKPGPVANSGDELLRMRKIAHDSVERDPQLAHLALLNLALNPDQKAIRLGSMSLAPDAMDATARLELQLFGEWTGESLELYPRVDLKGLACSVRPTSGADRTAEFAQFDVTDALSDDRQRDTGPIVFTIGEANALPVELRVRSHFEAGRNAVTELKLISSSLARSFGEKSIYIQMRPFTVAKSYPADLDAQSGSQIAVWRSDDPEGPQWRLADATVQLDLPPQAVGEEMERGNRFWKEAEKAKTSYIEAGKPVRYRFSPPTRIVVKPARDRERRYNVSPYNVSSVLKLAKVEAFRTEVVYPVQTSFQVSDRGLPDIRIGEVAYFLAQPAPNMPRLEGIDDTVPANERQGRKEDQLGKVFERELSKCAASVVTDAFFDDYASLRSAQSAARMNAAARVSEHRLFDPWRPDAGLDLRQGLVSRIRSRTQGARPMLSPLPAPTDLRIVDKKDPNIYNFLDEATQDWASSEKDGSLRAGVLYTIEFASELRVILANPLATETLIEKLAFTPIGANATVAVSFDEGRTTFTAEVAHGQLSKLIRTRIGRVALLWNKAKHVVVYQRDVVHSEQFADEQKDSPHTGRPLLRKWEEYVEPIERVRIFAEDAQKDFSVPGTIQGCEFITPRIYVNGAWGRDLYREEGEAAYGYEIPLWNRDDRSGFYPRPDLVLRAHAGGELVSRLFLDEPEHLYFYSNAEKGTGNDPDRWAPEENLDGAKHFARMPVVTAESFAKSGATEKMRLMRKSALPPARLGGFRRPRFDLAVSAESVIDVQHGRGDKPLLAAPTIVSLSRTQSDAPIEIGNLEKPDQDAFNQLKGWVQKSSSVAAVADDFARMSEQLPKMLLELSMDCATLKEKVKDELKRRYADATEAIKQVKTEIDPAVVDVAGKAVAQTKARAAARIVAELNAPVDRIRELSEAWKVQVRIIAASGIDQLLENQWALIKALSAPVEAAAKLVDSIERARGKAEEQLTGDVVTWLGQAMDSVLAAEQAVANLKSTISQLKQAIATATDPVKLVGDAQKAVAVLQEGLDSAIAGIEKARATLEKVDSGGIVGIVVADATRAIAETRHHAEILKASLVEVVAELDKPGTLDKLKGYLTERVTRQADSLAEGLDRAGNVLTSCKQHLTSIRDTLLLNLATEFQSQATLLASVKKGLDDLAKAIVDAVGTQGDVLRNKVLEIQKLAVGTVGSQVTALVTAYQREIRTKVEKVIDAALDATANTMLVGVMQVGARLNELSHAAGIDGKKAETLAWLTDSYIKAQGLIDQADCAQIAELQKAAAKLRDELQKARNEVEAKVTRTINQLVDDAARRGLEALHLSADKQDSLGKGIKLVKMVAGFDWRNLSINASDIECVLFDKDPAILTSPFVAKLKELEGGLQDLNLAVPTEELLEQLVPANLQGVDFNAVFKKFGGMDFGDFFRKFKLPELDRSSIRISQGVDRATQKAWLRAEVNKEFPGEQEVLSFASFALRTAAMKLDAVSNMEVSKEGATRSVVDAHLTANWILEFGGARLATFRQVTVSYNGSEFGFNISPNNIELHPAVQFASEFAKRFGEKLPPGIEFEKDRRGMPVGVRANFAAMVQNLPPLGPVLIGPMQILSGFGLRIAEDGKFVVSTHVSVGSRAAPVFVQITYLGGGMWLEAKADLIGGSVVYRATVGLALGAMRGFTLAGVARGHFSILLFANAEVSGQGGSLRAGALLQAHARILGICSAGISLLLEVVHSSGGDTSGHGELEVEVEICWCYTLHVHQSVNHQF